MPTSEGYAMAQGTPPKKKSKCVTSDALQALTPDEKIVKVSWQKAEAIPTASTKEKPRTTETKATNATASQSPSEWQRFDVFKCSRCSKCNVRSYRKRTEKAVLIPPYAPGKCCKQIRVLYDMKVYGPR